MQGHYPCEVFLPLIDLNDLVQLKRNLNRDRLTVYAACLPFDDQSMDSRGIEVTQQHPDLQDQGQEVLASCRSAIHCTISPLF
jgi:hypothetical protein